jgi:hypothetical protein
MIEAFALASSSVHGALRHNDTHARDSVHRRRGVPAAAAGLVGRFWHQFE